MTNNKTTLFNILSLFVLAILLVYTYAFLVAMPYLGFQIASAGGRIGSVYVQGRQQLQTGDQILLVDGAKWEDLQKERARPLFANNKPGDIIHLTILRTEPETPEQEITQREVVVEWEVPEKSSGEVWGRFFYTWILGYFFWLFGLAVVWFVRPRDIRWTLLALFSYLMALWLTLGGGAASGQIWYADSLMQSLTWPLVAIYLHFHWVFPHPMSRSHPRLRWAWHLAWGALAAVDFLGWLPLRSFSLALIAGILGGVFLLALRFKRFPEQRRDIGPLITILFTLAALFISLGVLSYLSELTWIAGGALLFTPLLPAAYFYAVYRQHLGGMQVRINRALTRFTYVILVICILIAVGTSAIPLFGLREANLFVLAATSLLAAFSPQVYPRYQHWYEHRFLGIPMPQDAAIRSFSVRLVNSLAFDDLARLLKDDLLPSLLVRQGALLMMKDGSAISQALCLYNLAPEQLPSPVELTVLLGEAGQWRAAGSHMALTCPWVRLALPLQIGTERIGLCLLGQRDPDDYYAPEEIAALESLVLQLALAIKHIEQTALLQAYSQSTIQGDEELRRRLAYKLHDDILGEVHRLASSVRQPDETFVKAYQDTTDRIRSMIGGLRPVSLEHFGLSVAIEELLDDLTRKIETKGSGPFLAPDLSPDLVRYTPEAELHLYRIAQQACYNTLQHAEAQHLAIRAELEAEKVLLEIYDDGKGFAADINLASLLIQGHYGLVTMYERAAMIGALLTIDSKPGQGTRVTVIWSCPQAEEDNLSE